MTYIYSDENGQGII